jgi:hypothetical protein
MDLGSCEKEELEAIAETLGGVGGEGRGGELVLDPVHSQLRLADATLVQLELRLFFDGVAEHVVGRIWPFLLRRRNPAYRR